MSHTVKVTFTVEAETPAQARAKVRSALGHVPLGSGLTNAVIGELDLEPAPDGAFLMHGGKFFAVLGSEPIPEGHALELFMNLGLGDRFRIATSESTTSHKVVVKSSATRLLMNGVSYLASPSLSVVRV